MMYPQSIFTHPSQMLPRPPQTVMWLGIRLELYVPMNMLVGWLLLAWVGKPGVD